jgi:hypothetical protein
MNNDAPTQPADKPLPRQQLEILDHAEHLAPGGYYCGGGPDMLKTPNF